MPPHAQERNRKACDKCHQQKLSCKKIGGGDECERCHRLKRPCTSSPPLRNQRNSTTRRNPREHDGSRRRPKTLAILPRSSPPVAAAAAVATTPSVNTTRTLPPASSYSYSSSESGSSYSQDQDTTAPIIPVMSEPMVTDTMDEQQQHHQYMEPLCWPGHAATIAEFSVAGFHPYFAPSWSDEEGISKPRYLVSGEFTDKALPPQDIGIHTVSGFPNFDRDLDKTNDDGPPPPPGAHIVQLQQSMATESPITSSDTRDLAVIHCDLESSYTASFSNAMGLGPGYMQYAGYGPGGRVRFDWHSMECAEPSYGGEMHSTLET
ncbi:hypothetical protein PG989_012315 [Apiospora arundinis]